MVVSGGLVRCSSKEVSSQCSAVVLGARWALTTATVLAAPLPAALEQLAAALDSAPLLARPAGLLAAASFAVDGRRAQPLALWRCPLVARATGRLLRGWTLGDSRDAESEVVRLLLPVFLLLEVLQDGGQEESAAPEDILRTLAGLLGSASPRGARVLVESTPFGSQFFLNSLSQGIVSNVLGPRRCLLLTDARTTHGCEGGPIFSFSGKGEGRTLIGLVACSLTWWRGEWVGFTLGVLLSPVLHQVLLSQSPVSSISNKDSLGLDDAIVMVHCGAGWGSGVVVDKNKGTIITCSHVISQVDSCAVTVQWKAHKLPARLLHRTRDGIAFDVAVISVGPVAGLGQVELAQEPPVTGEDVLAAGFPIFSEVDLPPTVTRGIVARVEGAGPSLLQSTCCVQSGASGGAVLRPSGQLLGLIVCNVKDHGSGAVYPHVNLAVPSAVLAFPLRQYAATADSKCLRELECDDPEVQRMWKLELLTSKL